MNPSIIHVDTPLSECPSSYDIATLSECPSSNDIAPDMLIMSSMSQSILPRVKYSTTSTRIIQTYMSSRPDIHFALPVLFRLERGYSVMMVET